jgi:hypothetical protein
MRFVARIQRKKVVVHWRKHKKQKGQDVEKKKKVHYEKR